MNLLRIGYVVEPGISSSGEKFGDGREAKRLNVLSQGRAVGFVENVFAGDDELWNFFHDASATEGLGFQTSAQAISQLKEIDKKYFGK